MSEPVRLEITTRQAALLADAEARLVQARERWLLVADVVLAGHDLQGAELVQLDTDQEPPVLTVKVAEAPEVSP